MDLGKLAELQHHRKCLECGEELETDENETALVKFSDHLVVHQPTASQWTEANNKIQAGKGKKDSAVGVVRG